MVKDSGSQCAESERVMIQKSLYFAGRRSVDIRETQIAPPGPDQVLVQTLYSAISAGSELIVYRGFAPQDIPVDETIPGLKGSFTFPMKYGYSTVGKVISIGKDIPAKWEGRMVFSFHAHESHFLTDTSALFPVPEGISPENALFLPNMETALSFLMDGQPMVGEQVIVFGQGIVGLLTTALLAMYPLTSLITLDTHTLRREYSLRAGAHACIDPGETDRIPTLLSSSDPRKSSQGADLVYELTGSPPALNQAIAVTGLNGRLVIGSWYGTQPVYLNLGGRFHRNRIRLISSQVSTINPIFLGRWNRSRRLDTAWKLIKNIQPYCYITQHFPISEASKAYEFLDRHPEESIQVIFTY
jgi:2-desacetyl-2-hydroxyethyl bacteriochlorophyllide A dehydrogenase